MTAEKRAAIRKFINDWKGRGDEKQDKDSFWTALLRDVYDACDVANYVQFEKTVQLNHQSYIDAYIPATEVLIEQKGINIDLSKGQKQSDGSYLSPFQQASRYAGALPYNERTRWIIVSNFKEFWIYDRNRPNSEPDIVKLEDLETEYYRMKFLVDADNENTKREEEISIAAGKIVGELYKALLEQYDDPENPDSLKNLNKLCVRIVFCLYAEDAGVFATHGMFHDYLKGHELKDVRRALIDLFDVLDTPKEKRDPYLDEMLLKFPFVNGGLFAEHIIIPRLNENIVDLILQRASANFDWSKISPTIFGAVFESTLDPDPRRKYGMHYTSIENIHKVIDPLFLDDLYRELEKIKEIDSERTRNRELNRFQDKLANLTFLDPACGSGNFLTETYLSLRRLENEVLRARLNKQITLGGVFDIANPVRVSIGQFHGIEINDFAVTVARAALWIAEIQMLQQTEDIIYSNLQQGGNLNVFPLKNFETIVEGNALRIDWESVVSKQELDYVMGNPPFVGLSLRNAEQQCDMNLVFKDNNRAGRLDYVSAWYKKAAKYIQNTKIEVAFVSTNSIVQGEQVPILWQDLFEKENIVINFAHRTFKWDSEATDKASVHCVIIGFSVVARKTKVLFEDDRPIYVDHINGYLVNADNIFIQLRSKAPGNLPKITQGNKPWDGGNLVLSAKERIELIKKYPEIADVIKPYIGSRELINKKERYCLWLEDVSPTRYLNIPEILDRLSAVAEVRRKTKTVAVRSQAETPMLFSQIRQPETNYLAIPEVSSESRRYIPIDFLPPDIIASNKLYLVPNANLYMFGVLISNIHMAWMRLVAGRLKSDYSYSPAVYNNFSWPNPTDMQRAAIEKTAQAILDARAKYPDASLADMYGDKMYLFPELLKAHQDNDRAVMAAYGITKDSPEFKSESACVAMLMRMYQELAKH